MHFYTNVSVHRGQIVECGYLDGIRYNKKVRYKPYLFVPTKKDSRYRTINHTPVDRVNFNTISEARNFIRQYDDVEGFDIYGLTQFQYTYIYDHFRDVKYDPQLIKECILDIEVDSEDGYPDLAIADKHITAITLMYSNITFCFGYGDFVTDDSSIKYIKCKDEQSMLQKLITLWESDLFRPDVVTGWNINTFDIPYIVKRISIVLGEGQAERLSPFKALEHNKLQTMGKEFDVFVPIGINILDYLQMYKKFIPEGRESYRLDAICELELKEKKLDYSEYENLAGLYKFDHQKFMEYNVRDCALIRKLNNKLRFLELVYTFAYDSGLNYVDALTSVRSWDVIIHRYLLDRKIVIPQRKVQTNTGSGIVGAYIKDPLVGMHGWIVSFDLTSLYPHLIISHNISPDTLKGRLASPFTVDQYVNGAANKVNKFLVDNNFSLAASNYYYDRSKQGFMADLMELFFQQRKQYKDLMLEAKKRFEKTKDPADEAEMAKFDNYQKAAKVKLNSAYGAFGNAYFRWYDKRLAESITMSGQLTIRWAEQKMNAFINEQIGTNDIDYIIAADTDSLYVNMGRLVEHFNWNHFDDNQIARNLDQYCEQIIQPFLNKIYNELGTYMNAHKSVLYMKREAIGNRGIWVAKKRYMINVLNNEGVWYKEPDLKIMGIESVRSSTPKVCRDAIEHLIKIIMTTDEATTQQEIENFRKQYYQLPFEDIAFPRGLNGLTKYTDSANVFASGCPIHVRGALSYNHFISMIKGKRPPEVRDREKVKWCYLKVPNPLGQNVIAVPQVLPRSLGLDKYIDYPLMFERTYLDAVNNILGKIGWEAEKQYKMRNFFE